MSDLLYLTMAAGFFLLAIAYVYGCEKLRGGSQWATTGGSAASRRSSASTCSTHFWHRRNS